MSDRSRVERAIARAIASSRGSSSNGLNRTATASDCVASERVLVSVLPVISIVGKPRPEAFRTSHISIPFISGMSMSTNMHAFVLGVSLASNSDGRPKVVTRKPEAESSLFNERRTDGSSSTTNTVAGLIVPTTFVSRTFDLALLDARSGRAEAAFLAKLVTILIFSFISDSCRCSAHHWGGGCLLLFCYKRVTLRYWTKVQYAGPDSRPNLRTNDRNVDTPEGAISAHPR
jgi:hypothetical protein